MKIRVIKSTIVAVLLIHVGLSKASQLADTLSPADIVYAEDLFAQEERINELEAMVRELEFAFVNQEIETDQANKEKQVWSIAAQLLAEHIVSHTETTLSPEAKGIRIRHYINKALEAASHRYRLNQLQQAQAFIQASSIPVLPAEDPAKGKG